jgi:hypothetical protein
VLVKNLRNVDGLRFGNDVYTVEFASKHHDKCFPKSRPFGIEYTFTLKDAVEGVPVRPSSPAARSCVCARAAFGPTLRATPHLCRGWRYEAEIGPSYCPDAHTTVSARNRVRCVQTDWC